MVILAASGKPHRRDDDGRGERDLGQQLEGRRHPRPSAVLPANDNLVEGNFIGTDVTGGAALPNGDGGLHQRRNTLGRHGCRCG